MIGNSAKLPGVTGAGDASNGKLAQAQPHQLGFSPKPTDAQAMLEGIAPANLLAARKTDKTGSMSG